MQNRIKDIYALFAALALLAVLFVSPEAEASTEQDDFAALQNASNSWRFRVFLDDKEIGYHHFYLAEDGQNRQLKSVANFEYRLLFVTLFRYEHENLENWSGDCLQSVRSRTDSNGDNYTVHGLRFDGGFQVVASEGDAALPPCVMSFAYWNPAFLEEARLLNTQDGRYLDVEVSSPVQERLKVRGEMMPSYRYHLEAGDLRLDLWYSDQNEWLALESTLESGRTLRYESI
ncbi:MAG: hypothetical protein KJN78_11200 [Gammaproteobacteria bacterium]|nr:hypothetical protein [Gammaproteobacteria bacterium]